MKNFQKILFVIAVFTLGFSIWYYIQLDSPKTRIEPNPVSPTWEGNIEKNISKFDMRDYGAKGEDADRLNDYFADVQQEVTGIIARDETVVITMTEFKTKDDYKRKLYMALSTIDRLKVVSQRACDRLKQKLADAPNEKIRNNIKQSQEYVVCFPGKW